MNVALSQKGESPVTRQEGCGAGPSDRGWLCAWQRACPRVEAGRTGAAEPGAAQTGRADQATSAARRGKQRATGMASGRGMGAHTRDERNRDDERDGSSVTSTGSHRLIEGPMEGAREEKCTPPAASVLRSEERQAIYQRAQASRQCERDRAV